MKIAVFANNLTERGVGNITTTQVALLTRRNVDVILVSEDIIPRDLEKWAVQERLIKVRIPSLGGALHVVRLGGLWFRLRRLLKDVDLVYVPDSRYGVGIYAYREHIPSVITLNMYWPLCHSEGLWYRHKPCNGCIWALSLKKGVARPLTTVSLFKKFLTCLSDYYSQRVLAHPSYECIYSMFKYFTIDLCIKYFNRIVTISNTMKSKFLSKYPELSDKVHVVNLGALLLPYIPPYIHPTISDELRLLYMSAPIEQKGIFHLIKAVELALKMDKNLKIKLKIIGGDNPLIKKFIKPSVKDHIELKPWMPRQVFLQKLINNEIRDADIVVVPSIWEDTWAGVATLAMALGRPVLAHNGGALREQVINGLNGFLINFLDIRSAAYKIIEISSHKETLPKMGLEARRIYLEKFTPDKLINELIKVFKDAIG